MSGGTRVPVPFRTPRMSPTGLSPAMAGRSRPFGYPRARNEPPTRGSAPAPQPPDGNACRLGTVGIWAVARSLAATRAISIDFSCLRVLRCFTSPRFAPGTYGFSAGFRQMSGGGLPHSDIPGSTPACGFPGLIAACHVLHRRSKPRHPPAALGSLTTRTFSARQCSCQRARSPPPRSDEGVRN